MNASRVEVRRRLLHWRPRWRGPDSGPDGPEGDLDADGGGGGGFGLLDVLDDLFAAVLIVVAAVLFVLFVVPAVLFVIEVLLVAVIAAVGLLGRVLLRRPWTLEAVDVTTDDVVATWQVHGFRHAGTVAAAIEARLAAGGDLPDQDEVATILDRLDAPTWPTT